MDTDEAWDFSTGSNDVIIAILDTGCDLDHPDYGDRVISGYDFINNDSNASDDHGHGTSCAGIAAAEGNNNLGVAGICWDCQIMPIKILATDYIVKIDTLKSVDVFHAEGYGVMDYGMELTSSVIDPFTKEKLSYPNIGKIRVKSKDVTDNKDDMHTIIISGRNYQNKGFNFEDPQTVNKHLSSLASRGFDIFLTRLLSEMPATAQVQGIKGNQVSLDRGQNAGILKDETMIIFQYEAGFVDPIGVAMVNPSKQSANGTIIRWKKNKHYNKHWQQCCTIKTISNNYRPPNVG